MLRAIIRNRLSAAERQLGVPLDYLRHVLDVSVGAFLKFAKVMPPEPWHLAHIVASTHEDCGACVQIGLNRARDAGVDRALLQSVLDNDLGALPDDLADVCRFATGVTTHNGDEDRLRERMRTLYGEAGLVELAFAIAVSRVFPTTKRALGFASSCAVSPPRA